RQPVRTAAKRDFVCAGANGESARHERRPSGRALGLDIEVEKPHTFARQFVDTRRGRTAKDATAVNAQLPVAQVVHEHKDNTRLLFRTWLLFRRLDRSDSTKCRTRGQ